MTSKTINASITTVTNKYSMAKIMLTMSDDVKREIRVKAAQADKSMNQFILDCVPLDTQIQELAEFIMHKIDGEPSQSEGAVECAIRLLKAKYVKPKEELSQEIMKETMECKGTSGNETISIVHLPNCNCEMPKFKVSPKVDKKILKALKKKEIQCKRCGEKVSPPYGEHICKKTKCQCLNPRVHQKDCKLF